MSGWQPEYDPRRTEGRPPQTPPQWHQGAPRQDGAWGGQPETWQQEAYPRYQQPQYAPQPRHQAPPPQRKQGSGYGPWIAGGAVVLVVIAGAAFYVLHGKSPAPAGATTGNATAAQPETEAGVRSAATQFYALYSASQWPQAWEMLTPAAQRQVPEATYATVHEGCPSASAGLARVIKGVTMAGSTAVVTETVAGVASSLGSVTDAWSYAGGRWGIALSQSSLADYSHGSASADVAAMKTAGGDCAN
jgi:hypothetical protein